MKASFYIFFSLLTVMPYSYCQDTLKIKSVLSNTDTINRIVIFNDSLNIMVYKKSVRVFNDKQISTLDTFKLTPNGHLYNSHWSFNLEENKFELEQVNLYDKNMNLLKNYLFDEDTIIIKNSYTGNKLLSSKTYRDSLLIYSQSFAYSPDSIVVKQTNYLMGYTNKRIIYLTQTDLGTPFKSIPNYTEERLFYDSVDDSSVTVSLLSPSEQVITNYNFRPITFGFLKYLIRKEELINGDQKKTQVFIVKNYFTNNLADFASYSEYLWRLAKLINTEYTFDLQFFDSPYFISY